MSEEAMNELESLKVTADELGVKYHPTIGAAALKTRITDFMNSATEPEEEAGVSEDEVAVKRKRRTARETRDEAKKLVRVRVSCMNPAKTAYAGEFFITGNALTGTMKHYVPFDVEWHVPQMILNVIQAAQCQIFVKKKVRMGNTVTTENQGKLVKAYSVEILPPLTLKELAELAQRQAMAAGTAPAEAG